MAVISDYTITGAAAFQKPTRQPLISLPRYRSSVHTSKLFSNGEVPLHVANTLTSPLSADW